jgi:hypothetical protein
MRVRAEHRRDRSTRRTLAFTCFDDAAHLAVEVEIDVSTIMSISKEASWWAEHGNAGMAKYELMKSAENEAISLAASLFRAHSRKTI